MNAAPFTPEEAARALGGRVVSRDRVRAPSPGTGPKDSSFEIKFGPEFADGFTVNDYYGGGDNWKSLKDFVRERVGQPWEPGRQDNAAAKMNARASKDFNNDRPQREEPKQSASSARPPDENVVATYDYTEADGTLLYQAVRYEPKDFRQRRPGGRGGWIWKSSERSVLYRWPDLIKYPDGTVFVCEGEKDADRVASLDHCAVTIDGRGKWTTDCIDALKGRHVFILEDNDEKGRTRALNAARALHGVTATLRIVRLPDLPERGDISDWLDADFARAEMLVGICLAAPTWESDQAGEQQKKDEQPPKLIVSSAEFVGRFIPPDYLIDGLIQRRFIYSMTAPTGSGKTAVALLITAHTALKRALGEYQLEGGRVLYLAGENPDDIRMRWLAMADEMDFDINTIHVHFLPGVFKLSEIGERIKAEIEKIGTVVLVVIDTSAAYFEGSEENANVEMGIHARRMRGLVNLPGGPCVLVACHPVKNATPDNLLPRGGGAFIAEVDGNLTVSKNESVSTLHWQGKFRGPDFAPIPFSLHTVTTEALKDSNSTKRIPYVCRQQSLLVRCIPGSNFYREVGIG
jgi:hypothetical protein